MNTINLDNPLPGIHDTFSRLLIAELDKRLDFFRLVTVGGWLIEVFALRPTSRILGYRIAQIGFMDDEIWFFLHLEGDARTRRYGRQDALAVYNLSDPRTSIEEAADKIAAMIRLEDKDT